MCQLQSSVNLSMVSFKRLAIVVLLFLFLLSVLVERIVPRRERSPWKTTTAMNTGKLSFARRSTCNLHSSNACDVSNKSLVITFWSRRSVEKWLITNLLSVFPEESFDYVIMIHDHSSWSTHPAYEKAIWIHVHDQTRFWFLKRFLSPTIVTNYRYLWIVDDDIRLHFHPLAYQCVADRFDLLLSSPARLTGAISYLFTRISPHYADRVGRWTDFVETGPLTLLRASAFACLWPLINAQVSTGFGLDLIWCRLLRDFCFPNISSERICAIVDSFAYDHLADGIYSVDTGNAELPAYDRFYSKYQTKRQIFASIDRDSTVADSCQHKYPIDRR